MTQNTLITVEYLASDTSSLKLALTGEQLLLS